jgi:hypothetical protein
LRAYEVDDGRAQLAHELPGTGSVEGGHGRPPSAEGIGACTVKTTTTTQTTKRVGLRNGNGEVQRRNAREADAPRQVVSTAVIGVLFATAVRGGYGSPRLYSISGAVHYFGQRLNVSTPGCSRLGARRTQRAWPAVERCSLPCCTLTPACPRLCRPP